MKNIYLLFGYNISCGLRKVKKSMKNKILEPPPPFHGIPLTNWYPWPRLQTNFQKKSDGNNRIIFSDFLYPCFTTLLSASLERKTEHF